jgi:hypothetical protein
LAAKTIKDTRGAIEKTIAGRESAGKNCGIDYVGEN